MKIILTAVVTAAVVLAVYTYFNCSWLSVFGKTFAFCK